jgi:transcriptional regulator with XRE-family HTH domain
MDEAAIITAFCQKLKSLRQAKELTLEELCQLSGVSVSTISKIENQQQKPSFETVLKVSRALHINFVHMLETPAAPPRNMARRVITRAQTAPEYKSDFYTYTAHGTELSNKTMVPLLMQIKTHELPPREDWSVHDGEEFVYVLDGVVELHTEQYAPAILEKGDSCYLDSTMRHAYVSKSAGEATVLAICLSIVPFAGP